MALFWRVVLETPSDTYLAIIAALACVVIAADVFMRRSWSAR